MNPREALEEVRKDLTQAFGEALAVRIVAEVHTAAPEEEIDASSYRKILASLCKDERVLGMFGVLGVRDKQQRWEELV